MDTHSFHASERRDRVRGHKQKIIEAVRSNDVERLISALQDTNIALTGSELGHFSAGAGIERLKIELTKFFEEAKQYGNSSVIVFLGDGGLSRLVLSIEKGKNIEVELTYNSTDEVKNAWGMLQ